MQGLWDFISLREYWDYWLVPHVLKGLETVFEGASDRWRAGGEFRKGRGDFTLATVLFAWFEHFGSFLGSPADPISGRRHIENVASSLPSTNSIPTIVGHFARNSLVHSAWPRTILFKYPHFVPGQWAFGLSISADPSKDDHLRFYCKHRPFPSSAEANAPWIDVPVFKLILNVRSLRLELDEFVRTRFLACADPELFAQRRREAIRAAVPPYKLPKPDDVLPPKIDAVFRELEVLRHSYPEIAMQIRALDERYSAHAATNHAPGGS
jgi:hypothetical protein